MKLVLIYLQIAVWNCCYASGILTSLEKAYDFTYSFDCPEKVLVDEVFSCNLTVEGGERVMSTVQWENSPPVNFQFTGELQHFKMFSVMKRKLTFEINKHICLIRSHRRSLSVYIQ